MKLKEYTLLGVFLCGIPILSFAQKIEHFLQTFPVSEGRPLGFNRSTSIVSLKESPDGIYVLTQNDGCYLIKQSLEPDVRPLALPTDRKDVFIDLVIEHQEVKLWTNEHEIASLTDNASDRLPFTNSYFAETVEAKHIAIDGKGTIYVGTAADGIFAFTKDEWNNYSNLATRISTYENQLPSNNIQCFYKDPTGVIWVGTNAGLASIVDGKVNNLSKKRPAPQKKWQKLFGFEKELPVFTESVTAISKWGDSMLFAGTNDLFKGYAKIDSLHKLNQYYLSDRLSSPLQDVKQLMVDIDGNVWIAGNHLLQYNITTDRLNVISDQHHFRGQGFMTVAEDLIHNKVWIGTVKGGLYRIDYPDPKAGIGF